MSTMKTKPKLRARRMWANYYKAPFNPCLHKTRRAAALGCGHACIHTGRVAVIPLDDVEALVDAAVASHSYSYCGIATRRQAMRAALTAIGVLPRQRKGGRK